ncbi:MAG: hypothetical protein LC135_02250 [Phycisphaerae bacterium]|nr:hypothetical protein [Phycisphaerae bacterium]MCZ2398675.1 hypothetical protein [Phycisphaerae bacterium]NUQ50202.1 hypothetical protein [Phycisphaerae bacterium]
MNGIRLRPQSRRLRVAVAALAMLCAASAALVAPGQVWKELGPAPVANFQYAGRISAVACSPTDPNLYYVGGADGGVWRTRDGGTTWTPLTRFAPTLAMGAIAIAPSDENTIYAGTGEAAYANHSRYGLGILKSTDGGDTWTHLGEAYFAGRCFSSLLVHPQDADVVYASITRAGGFPEMAAAKGHPQRFGPLGVFRSVDGGVTWSPLTNGLPAQSATRLAMSPADPNVLYAAIGHPFGDPLNNGIYKTTDGGASWSKLAGGLPLDSIGRISLAVAPGDANRLYALIARSNDAFGGGASTLGAFRSDNAGLTWTPLPDIGNIQATYGWYISCIGVNPSDPNIVLMGGVPLVRSLNGGLTWSTVTPAHVDIHQIVYDAAGRAVSGTDGGVYRSGNNGTSWTAFNQALGTIQFYAGLSTHPADATILFGGTQDNGSNRRSTDTLNWDQVLGGDGGWTQVDQANPLRVFAEFQGTGNLYRSLNGGASFSLTNSGIAGTDRNCFLPPYLIDPANSNRMLYATHRIYRSLNGGTSWTAISGDLTNGPPAAIRTLAMAPSDPNVVYAATNDGNVQVSTNGGVSWTLVASGVAGWPRVTREIWVSPRAPATVYLALASFGEQRMLRSFNAGQSWEALAGDLPDVPVNTVAVDERTSPPMIYAGTDRGVYRSLDDGESWHRPGQGMPHAAVIDLQLDLARQRLLAGTQGAGAWSIAARIPGDIDGDCVVGQSDLGTLLAAWNTSSGDPRYNPDADLDNDGYIGQTDLGILLAQYGGACL